MPAGFEAVSPDSVLQSADRRKAKRAIDRGRPAGGADVSVACIRFF